MSPWREKLYSILFLVFTLFSWSIASKWSSRCINTFNYKINACWFSSFNNFGIRCWLCSVSINFQTYSISKKKTSKCFVIFNWPRCYKRRRILFGRVFRVFRSFSSILSYVIMWKKVIFFFWRFRSIIFLHFIFFFIISFLF